MMLQITAYQLRLGRWKPQVGKAGGEGVQNSNYHLFLKEYIWALIPAVRIQTVDIHINVEYIQLLFDLIGPSEHYFSTSTIGHEYSALDVLTTTLFSNSAVAHQLVLVAAGLPWVSVWPVVCRDKVYHGLTSNTDEWLTSSQVHCLSQLSRFRSFARKVFKLSRS